MNDSKIFFDPEDARQRSFELQGWLTTGQGRTYEVGEWLGRGGHGSVFACVDRGTGDEYAVKFLLSPGWKAGKRFLREIRLLRTIESDHVIGIHGDGKIRAREVSKSSAKSVRLPFFIMDLAQGNLTELLKPGARPLTPEVYTGQFRGLATALADLHAVAIHRDIKPENILIQGDRWMLGDYGLCAFNTGRDEDLTGERENVGPKFWMSPEGHNRRIGREDIICAASDVYQMAAIFWYVVTGRHPSGTLTRDDWRGPEALFDPIYQSLLHDVSRRPSDGRAFLDGIASALMA